MVGETPRDQPPLWVPLSLQVQQTFIYKTFVLYLSLCQLPFLLFDISNHYPQHPLLSSLKTVFKGRVRAMWRVPAGSTVKSPPADAGDTASIPGLGRSPGGGTGNPLRDSCLGNPMDRGAWRGYSPRGSRRVQTQLNLQATRWAIFIALSHVYVRLNFCVLFLLVHLSHVHVIPRPARRAWKDQECVFLPGITVR